MVVLLYFPHSVLEGPAELVGEWQAQAVILFVSSVCMCVCAFMRSRVPMPRVARLKSFSDCFTFDTCSLGSELVWDDRLSALAARMLSHLPRSCLSVALPSGSQVSRPKSAVSRYSCLNLERCMMFENCFSLPCLADYSLRRAFIAASWYRALCALVLLRSLICSPSHVAAVYQVKMRHRGSWYWKFGCMRGGSGCTSCSEEMTAGMRNSLQRVCQDAGL